MRSPVALLTVLLAIGAADRAIARERPADGAPAQRTSSDQGRAAAMRDHYTDALSLHTAVIAGDLKTVASAAATLARYDAPGGNTPGAEAQVDAIRRQAGLAGSAKDIVGAAYATAVLLSACGDCHRLAGVMPAAPLPPRPAVGSLVGHMLAHQRAADQMLQGLVVPSASLWKQGTTGFIAAPFGASDFESDPARKRRMLDTEQRLHRVAGDAAQATDSKSRASFYAQLLGGCSDCHRRTGSRSVPR